jgi:hypothetical protein
MKPGACPRLFEVEALRDGRLGAAERSHFERHVMMCAVCSREARSLDELARALRHCPAEPRGDELQQRRERTRLLAAFDRALVSEGHSRTPARRWVALASMAVLAATLIFFWREAPSTPDLATSSAAFRADAGTLWSRRVEAQRELVVLERGVLWIQVATVPNKLPLLVRLPDGELEDIGTTFSVTVEAGRTAGVAVEEGRVVLRLHGRAPVVIAAGESWPEPPVALSTPEPSLPRPAAAPGTERVPTGLEPATPLEPPTSARKPSKPRASASAATAPGAASNDFREAMAALHTGQSRDAAARFTRFIERHPRDARAEDAAYMRVLALREAGDDAGMKAAARQYLGRHPQGFRRAEVEALLR